MTESDSTNKSPVDGEQVRKKNKLMKGGLSGKCSPIYEYTNLSVSSKSSKIKKLPTSEQNMMKSPQTPPMGQKLISTAIPNTAANANSNLHRVEPKMKKINTAYPAYTRALTPAYCYRTNESATGQQYSHYKNNFSANVNPYYNSCFLPHELPCMDRFNAQALAYNLFYYCH